MPNETISPFDPQVGDSQLDLQKRLVAAAAKLGGERIASAVHATVQTSASGATWVTLGAAACDLVTLINNTGTDLEVRRGGAGVGIPVLDGNAWPFRGLTDASNLSVRRLDQSNTQVTAYLVLETF